MGEEIAGSAFKQDQFDEFRLRLRQETASLMTSVKEQKLQDQGRMLGLELECWLTDENHQPVAENQELLDRLGRSEVVPELSKFNVEINTPPLPVTGDVLSRSEEQLGEIWGALNRSAAERGHKVFMIGTLPTLSHEMLCMETMTDRERYRALNEQVMGCRGDKPIHVVIEGAETLDISHSDVMLEAATTSLQIHLAAEPEQMVSYYNASLLASAITAAVCANTPLLFKKSLWSESRIPLFEKSLLLPGFVDCQGEMIRRVTFGSGFMRQSALEVFIENLDDYPILLPTLFDTPREKLKHLHVHNGSIWRWNRPIIEGCETGQPHLRVEHRVPAAGPTLTDAIAHMALYVGLCHSLVTRYPNLGEWISFDTVRRNFYEAAEWGLEAQIHWPEVKGKRAIVDMLNDGLLAFASQGLKGFGVQADEAEWYTHGVLAGRFRQRRTGSTWQKDYLSRRPQDFTGLAEAYHKNQLSNKPLAQWEI